MSKYILPPKLYNTGFIPLSASALRIKQGLAPQNISNACSYTPTPKNVYTGQAHPHIETCQNGLYPAKQVQLSLPDISDNCLCLDYNQAPYTFMCGESRLSSSNRKKVETIQ